ncbi:MAG: hypothetical protein LBD24_04785 [Spirochaetaceae bacterium]|nr:hypothetical protein [Spirochaetaceae bacterium]
MQTVGGCAKRSRAWAVASPLIGQGVALFGSNKRPCLKQPEAADKVLHYSEATSGHV